MHVAVDGRALRPGAARARGVARYLRLLLDELRATFPADRYTVIDPGRARLASAALAGRPRLDRIAGRCDVVWIPAPAPVAVSRGTPVVLTVHDLSFEHRRGDYSMYDRAWLRLARPGRLARRADRVICVSELTRRAVIEEWDVPPERTRTVLSGPGKAPSRPDGARPDGARELRAATGRLPETFILVVGALEPRKMPMLVEAAHRRARAAGLHAGLVFAGDGPVRGQLEATGVTLLGHVSDADLDLLYRRALAVVCASREEGFGFSPLEAAARGTPAVVADLGVFDETLGAAAVRVPVGDEVALAHALLELEGDEERRRRLAAAAREAAARLSWTAAARATRAAFVEAASR